MMGNKKRLGVVALGIGVGVATGLTMLLFTWACWWGGYGKEIVDLYASMFPGLTPTLFGGIVAGVWGFFEGFIFGVVTAFFYNLCLCCCPSSRCCSVCGSNKCTCGPGSCTTRN